MALAILPQPVKPLDPDLLALADEVADVEGLNPTTAQVIAELYQAELAGYGAAWDAWAASKQPRCPMCGATLEPRQSYVGGKGYRFFQVCSGNTEHYSTPA